MDRAGILFLPTGNRLGPRTQTLSGIPKAFGNQYKTMKKAFSPSALTIKISGFAHNYTKLKGNVTTKTKEDFYTIAAMMKFQATGGSFETNPDGWRIIREELIQNLDIQSQPELYVYFSDPCIRDTDACPQNFLLMRNPSVPRIVFNQHVSSIAENINHIPPFIVKNLERLIISQPSEDEILQMENPLAVSRHESLLQYLIEDCGKCFKSEMLCIACAMSIANVDDAIRHINFAHKQNCDDLVFADWNERRRQRDEDEKNKLREQVAQLQQQLHEANSRLEQLQR